MQVLISEIKFSQISEIWSQHLWPNRISPIEATSALTFDLKIDIAVQKNNPVHLGAFSASGEELIGVLSGHPTVGKEFRSRGLWVKPEARKCGVARRLMQELEHRALALSRDRMWTLARRDSWPVYSKLGYRSVRETNAFEFGPHLLAEKFLIVDGRQSYSD